MAIDSNNWGPVVVSSKPKKTTIVLDIDMKTGDIKNVVENKDETKAEQHKRIKENRGRKLGLN